MEQITEAGTIDQLVRDAADAGHQVSARLIRDWSAAGLLDYPLRRGAGKGHGSQPAVYSANQRNLFLTLLHHRPDNGIKSLARIPVGIWMYWGDAFVPLSQARRAMSTWLGDPRVSLRRAREAAQEVVRQLDNPAATPAARRRLINTLADIAYTGRADLERLEPVIRDVFEPGTRQIRRVVGHPDAPLMTESMIGLIRARLVAVDRFTHGRVTDEDFHTARHAHLVAYAQYALQQPQLAAAAPASARAMYEPVTAEITLNSCCGNLLTSIGLAAMHPDRAAGITALPAPRIRFEQ